MSRERHTGTRSLCNRQVPLQSPGGQERAAGLSPPSPGEGRQGLGPGWSWRGPRPVLEQTAAPGGRGAEEPRQNGFHLAPRAQPLGWDPRPPPPHPPSGGRGWESPAPPVYSLCGVAVDTTAMLWGAIPEVPGGGCPDSGIGWPMAPRPPIPPRAWPGPRAGRPRPAAPAAGPPVRLCSAFMGSAGHRACVSGQCALTWARKPS